MALANLMPLVRGYLESAGFKIIVQEDGCIVGDKLLFGQERDTWVVWPLPADLEPAKYESTLRGSVATLRPNYPDARAFVVAWSRAGFSRSFYQALSDLRVKFVVPIWFFDAAFRVEEAPKAASAIADIRSLDILKERVPQPYRQDSRPGESADLFDTLLLELNKGESPTVRVVVGRAGIGKTFLFRALFARMYEEFLQAKSGQALGRRPIPLLPEHLKGVYAIRTELLVDNFLRTDVAAPVERQTFEWLLVNGFTTWLLDGLDELYAGDPYFFEYLSDLVTRKASKAQITIWCRDSLLTTSDEFAEFQELFSGSDALRIYHLSDWERPSKRRFAWVNLEGRIPKTSEEDTPQVASFLRAVDTSPTLRSLSGLPFYCRLLLEQFRAGAVREFAGDISMLDYVIDQMIKREVDKGLLDLRLFAAHGLDDWLELIAVDYVEGRRYADIDRNEAMEYGKLVLQDGVDQKTQNHILVSLLQFPLFRAGAESGRIAFAHDLIAEALAARVYLGLLARQPSDVGRRLSRVDLQDPSLLRFIASRMGHAEEAAVIEVLRRAGLEGRSFAILVSLLMLGRPERDLVKGIGADFDGRDLTGVRFEKRDLGGLSFRCADLSFAVFADCDLRGARFEGAYFNRTCFEGENELQDAQFGDRSRLQSLFDRRKLLDDPVDLREWVARRTGRVEPLGEPCVAALQTRYLFSKFISPLGSPRRDDHNRRALLAGKWYGGAGSPDEYIEAAVRHGYFTGPDFRDRFRRAAGDKYAEMVKFVRDGNISDSLGRLIAELCRARGCTHQLRP
jgi:hypothetical protein